MSSRDHSPYYERSLDQQVLDALLRIEEILARAFPAQPKPVPPVPVAEPPALPKGKRK